MAPYAYVAKAPTSSDPEVPDGWPDDWDFPYPPIDDPDSDLDEPDFDIVGPWPPGWPIGIEDGQGPYTIVLTADDGIGIDDSDTLAVSADVLESGIDTSELEYHLICVVALNQDSDFVGLKKASGDAYSDAIYYQVTNYSGSKYGFQDDIYFNLAAGNTGDTIRLYAAVVSVSPYFLDYEEVSVRTYLEGSSAGIATADANLRVNRRLAGTSDGLSTAVGNLSNGLWYVGSMKYGSNYQACRGNDGTSWELGLIESTISYRDVVGANQDGSRIFLLGKYSSASVTEFSNYSGSSPTDYPARIDANYCCTSNGASTVRRSTDGGITWSSVSLAFGSATGLTVTNGGRVINASTSRLICALVRSYSDVNNTSEVNIQYSDDSGATWTGYTLTGLVGNPHSIQNPIPTAITHNVCLAYMKSSTIYFHWNWYPIGNRTFKSTDNGVNWTVVATGTGFNISYGMPIVMNSGRIICIPRVASGLSLHYSDDDFATAPTVISNGGDTFGGAFVDTDNTVYRLMHGVTTYIQKSVDEGASWTTHHTFAYAHTNSNHLLKVGCRLQ